ncbi:MAG: hypothetical protein KF893_08850 [Caldilineaceae bacterium]|nr:hypothetical protein [Caldilineaceae bacterium]
MTTSLLTKQYILNEQGAPIGIILPIEEYEALIQSVEETPFSVQPTLFGALKHLGGAVASTDLLDETIREVWATWDKGEEE